MSVWDLIEKEGYLFIPPVNQLDENAAKQHKLPQKEIDLACNGKLFRAVLRRPTDGQGMLYFFSDDESHAYLKDLSDSAGDEVSLLAYLSINYRKEEGDAHYDFSNICRIIEEKFDAEVELSEKFEDSVEMRVRHVNDRFGSKKNLLEELEVTCLALSLLYRSGINIFYINSVSYHKTGKNVLGNFIFEILPTHRKVGIVDQEELRVVEEKIKIPEAKRVAKGLQNFYNQRSSIARIAIGWAAVEDLMSDGLRPEHILDKDELSGAQEIIEILLDIPSHKKKTFLEAIRDVNRMRIMSRNEGVANRIAAILEIDIDEVKLKLSKLNKARGKIVHTVYHASATELIPHEEFIESILLKMLAKETKLAISQIR